MSLRHTDCLLLACCHAASAGRLLCIRIRAELLTSLAAHDGDRIDGGANRGLPSRLKSSPDLFAWDHDP
ncbi:hypothetical protein KC19_11G058600 [Ceratodon purpureus]|uniref:Secreted protein n=1 Tax=Ceratodon purpureus TaxID=3225 RepID=A0A8T0GBE4_CERPU|nr:hypothetical protein KC19_11G058600 [Ceratodon purpureus]